MVSFGCAESECPGTGSPLGLGSPLVESQWTTGGCFDANSWVASVDASEASWTVEVDPLSSGVSPMLGASELGVMVMTNNDLHGFDEEGRHLVMRSNIGPGFIGTFAVAPSGHLISGSIASGVPQYRVFDANGEQVWLRLLAVDNPIGSFPGIALDHEDRLWVALGKFENDDFAIELQRWEITGERLATVTLPGISSGWMAIDGEGRFAIVDNELELFDDQGVALGAAQIDDKLNVTDLASLPEGFVIGGYRNDRAMVVRIDGEGAVVWSTELDGRYNDYGRGVVSGVVGTAEGGVIAVGSEGTISTTYSDSPLTNSDQPFVVAFDGQGELMWGERIAAAGWASDVALGPGGEVYVAGVAQAGPPNEYGSSDQLSWLRRYD